MDVPEEFRAAFGMPKIWSEKEQARIENAVSIMAYRKKTIGSVEDMARHEEARVKDILLSKKAIPVENGISFNSRSRIQGLEYVSRTLCRYENGLGYVFTFTATDGTFAQNLPAFEKFEANVSFKKPTEIPQSLRDRNHYELALEYYKFGPTHAKTVIAELERHVEKEKNDARPFILLGVTHMGVEQFDQALKAFDKAERIARANKSLNPMVFMLRAQCHFHKKEFQKAHDVLKPMWAFFDDDPQQKAQYDALLASINEQLKKQGADKQR